MFLLSSVVCMAQDVITKKDGTDISAKVLEISDSAIKYKKFDNQEGPTYVISTSDILLIRYENGEKDIFNKEEPKQESAVSRYSYSSNGVDSGNTTASVVPGMKYREYKNLYKTRNYVPSKTDPYSRGWAGVASLFIPGLGQGIDGEWGRGFAFIGANIGLYLVSLTDVTVYEDGKVEYGEMYWFTYLLRIGLNIWSICDAVHVAKVKNMYNQDLRANRAAFDLEINPYITCVNSGIQNNLKPAAGLSLKVVF